MERLDAADALWLDQALAEGCGGEAPPDLRARIRAAGAVQRATAAAAVEAARPARTGRRWLAAALALLGIGALFGVFALKQADAAVLAQDPATEIAVADAAQLAALLPQVTLLAMIARSNEKGVRLPDLPEHAGVVVDTALRRDLLAALGSTAVTGKAFALGDAQAELQLHTGAGYARCRLRFAGETVTFGTAAFALPEALPPAVGKGLRAEWQRLASATPAPRRKVQVATVRELIAAIGSDVAIELVGGPFELSPSDEQGDLPDNPAAVWRDDGGNSHLELHGVRNLHLRAVGGRVRLLGTSPGDVLGLAECQNVWCEGLILGHKQGLTPACSAPVVTLANCRDVVFRCCELFGCGTEGVVADGLDGFALERCEVHTCLYGIARFEHAKNLRFDGTVFRDCGINANGLVFHDCEGVAFRDCSVSGMDDKGGGGWTSEAPLFDIQMDEAVQFIRGSIRGNRCKRLATSKLLLARDGTDEGDNGPDVTPKRAVEAGMPRK